MTGGVAESNPIIGNLPASTTAGESAERIRECFRQTLQGSLGWLGTVSAFRPGLRLLIDHAYMSGHYSPTFGESDPGLHLPPNLSGRTSSVIQRGCQGMIAPVTADNGSRKSTRQAERRTCGAKGCNFCITIEVFIYTIADRACIITERFI